jgi:predicted RNA binding protein YcfA (HicA-like mRNA interferase family)
MPSIRPINYKRLVKVFEKAGFVCVRQEGDHLVFTKHGITRPVIIPQYHHVPIFIIKNNLRTGKISKEEYFELLKNI